MENKTAKIGGNTVAVRCSTSLGIQAELLLGLFHRLWMQGVPIEAGKKIQLGWSILSFRQEGPGLLVVCEPDFSRNPFLDMRDDVSCTLGVQQAQNTFAKQIQVEILPASFQDKVVIAKGCLSTSHIYLERNADPKKGDSGWYIGSCEPTSSPPDLEAIYVYELLQCRPSVLQCLGLPPGYLVVYQNEEVEAVLNASNENVFAI